MQRQKIDAFKEPVRITPSGSVASDSRSAQTHYASLRYVHAHYTHAHSSPDHCQARMPVKSLHVIQASREPGVQEVPRAPVDVSS